VAPQFVKPYVKSNKNDANDAEAICEAMGRPHMRFVSVKSVEQQDIQAVHRVRAELIKQRTAKANQIRGLVAEYGLVAPKELGHLRRALPCWLEDAENGLSGRFRRLLNGLWGDLQALDERLSGLDREITLMAQSDPVARRLQQLRGVGPIIATALVAAVGNGEQFAKGRQMSAALGLTPRQQSSGGKERLLGISKQGDVYLRALLIHGARAVKPCQSKLPRLIGSRFQMRVTHARFSYSYQSLSTFFRNLVTATLALSLSRELTGTSGSLRTPDLAIAPVEPHGVLCVPPYHQRKHHQHDPRD
jgi:transposase